MNIGTDSQAIELPASEKIRPIVTAGLAKEDEAVKK